MSKTKRVLYIAAGDFLFLAALFKFCFIGYTVTALLLLGGAVCLALFGLLADRKTKTARQLRMALIVFLCIGAICFLAAEIPILADCRSDADTSADYLIVCGAGIIDGTTLPSRSMLDRLVQTVTWLEENPDGVAILSGSQGPNELISEAQAMYNWLTSQNIDPSRLMLEDAADNSYENIANSLVLIAAHGGDPTGRVAILSSEYHLHRLGYMAERMGCQPVPVAARTSNPIMFLNYAAREAFAMWQLWVFGM